MAKKNKNVDPLELGGPDLVNDIEGNNEFAPTEEPAEEVSLDDLSAAYPADLGGEILEETEDFNETPSWSEEDAKEEATKVVVEDEPAIEDFAEEEMATLEDAIALDDDPPPPNLDAFLDSIEDFADRDIRPDDTVFVKVQDDLYVSGKVVAIDGEAPCYGLQIKALGNRVVSVHVSRVEKTAEPDNVKRRIRFSNKTLKKWATPAE